MIVNIKPLTVNQCWQGKRFKTPEYKAYEKELLFKLKKMQIPKGKLSIFIQAGLSNSNADIDNIAKPFIDILQKKYGFNDNRIYEINMIKDIVPRGTEYIDFYINEYRTESD